MSYEEVNAMIILLSENNSGVAFVYSNLNGQKYEIAIQFSEDSLVEDISYKLDKYKQIRDRTSHR